jgi:alanine racemase
LTRSIDRSLAEAGLPPLQRTAWVEVDIDQLQANGRALADLAAPAELGPVVKADGYGHGLEAAARCAVAAGASWLCVADTAEAERLRNDGYEGRVLVLYPAPPSALPRMSRLQVDVSVGSLEGALSTANGEHSQVAAHLEIDTGMTRGGVAPSDALQTAATLAAGPGSHLAGVWTHLAAPEDSETTARQMELFQSTLRQLESNGIDPGITHVSASGGLLAVAERSHMVRPGLAYYGLHPGAGGALPSEVRPALALRAHPVRIAEVPVGTAVGYAGTWVAQRTSRIATVPVGYADGWSRSGSPGTFALVAGQRVPVVGRISSDSLTVDITDVAGAGPHSRVTLLGNDGEEEVSADEVAGVRGTISWEVLQQLGARLTRVYFADGRPVASRPESSTDLNMAADGTLPDYRTQHPPLSPTRPDA